MANPYGNTMQVPRLSKLGNYRLSFLFPHYKGKDPDLALFDTIIQIRLNPLNLGVSVASGCHHVLSVQFLKSMVNMTISIRPYPVKILK